MAAEALAHALHHDLYRVDLSSVVSKWLGETEKNLASAFDEAERSGAVLFFDEADALFATRTEVRDAHDRYANLEVNYLLQRVEAFTGLVMLASNRRSALDEAFLRRLRFVIHFEMPDRERAPRSCGRDRSHRPPTRVELDWDALAAGELAGASIQNVALSAAFLAAADGGTITLDHLALALGREYDKLGKSFPGLPLSHRSPDVTACTGPTGSARHLTAPDPARAPGRSPSRRGDRSSVPIRGRGRGADPAVLRSAIEAGPWPALATRRRGDGGPAVAEPGPVQGVSLMTLLKGMLLSFDDPLLGIIPTVILFQYNPTEVTRVFRNDQAGAGAVTPSPGARSSAPKPAIETYTLKLELDATDGLEKEYPISMGFGISPATGRPRDAGPAGGQLAVGRAGGQPARRATPAPPCPAGKVPLVFFAWGPARITPARLDSLTIHETAFDELLNPIHASADISLTVLRKEDLGTGRHPGPGRGRLLQGRPRGQGRAGDPPDDRAGLMSAPDPTSRYAHQPTVTVPGAGGAPVVLSTPRVVPAPDTGGRYQVRPGGSPRPDGAGRPGRLHPVVGPGRRQPVGRRRPARGPRPHDRAPPMPDTRLLVEIDGTRGGRRLRSPSSSRWWPRRRSTPPTP